MARTAEAKLDPIVQGDDPTYTLEIDKQKDDGSVVNRDISNWELTMTFKKDRNTDDSNAEILLNNTGNGGANITNASKGLAEFDLDENDTQGLFGEYYWKIKTVDENNNTHTLWEGTVDFIEA